MMQISPPQTVRPHDIWTHEAHDFTPWLSENLPFLAKSLNIELELEAREKSVGEFRADLVCRSRKDNSRIVIENQLGKSDHSHLGQVLTYAAGLQAATIVWLTTEFREAHRVTLDWHNEITSARFKFFGGQLILGKMRNHAIWRRSMSSQNRIIGQAQEIRYRMKSTYESSELRTESSNKEKTT